jgi:hypothetical protein
MTVASIAPRQNPSAPPADLAPKEAAIWVRLVAEYGLSDAPAIVLLEQLCRNLQLARECREVIDQDGKLQGTREHPLLRTWRDADKVAHQALRSLNFDLEPLRDRAGRPPGSRGIS